MNKVIIVGSVLLLVGILTTRVTANLNTAQDEINAASAAASDYINAFHSHDINTLITKVDDKRFNDKTELQKMYMQFDKEMALTHRQISLVGITRDSNGTIIAKFNQTDDYGSADFPVPILNENGEWKLVIDGNLHITPKK